MRLTGNYSEKRKQVQCTDQGWNPGRCNAKETNMPDTRLKHFETPDKEWQFFVLNIIFIFTINIYDLITMFLKSMHDCL